MSTNRKNPAGKVSRERNVTLVAQYRDQKEPCLEGLVQHCIRELEQALPGGKSPLFKPYGVEQVHGTLMQLEATEVNRQLYSKWLWDACKERGNPPPDPLDLKALYDFLKTEFKEPMQVRFGGFRLHEDYGFRSVGQHPYYRSFYLGDGLPMAGALAGWPWPGSPDKLDQLRRRFRRVNVGNKWTMDASRKVLDLYCVLGRIEGKGTNKCEFDFASKFRLADVASRMRTFIAELNPDVQWVQKQLEPLQVEVSERTLAIVRYRDTTLPISSTECVPLRKLTLAKLRRLYR